MTPEKEAKILEEPKDLGIKIGSPEEIFWTDVKTKAKQSILDNERSMIINKAIVDLASKKIEEEINKLKSKKNS